GEAELAGALGAGDLDDEGASGGAEVEGAGAGGRAEVEDDAAAACRAGDDGGDGLAGAVELGAADVEVADAGVDAGDLVVEVAVAELGALGAGGAGDAVDGLEDGVDLELVRLALRVGEAGGVGAAVEEALELDQHAADLLEAALGDVHDLVGAFAVLDGG